MIQVFYGCHMMLVENIEQGGVDPGPSAATQALASTLVIVYFSTNLLNINNDIFYLLATYLHLTQEYSNETKTPKTT